jgi:hypothetical protein
MNSTTYLVNTTNGSEVPQGMVQLSSNLRETASKAPTPEQRYRNVLIKELILSASVEDKFKPVLLDKLYSLAKERFEEAMEASNRLATTVPQEDYTIAGLLSFYATDAKSGRMTKESILDWFNTSTTQAYITGKVGEAKAKVYGEQYAKFASPNHGVNPNTCRALLATLQPEDMSYAIPAALASKMQATISKSEQSLIAAL